MDARALLLYKHCLQTLGIDQAKLTEETLEKYRTCCKIIVRVNLEAEFDQLCDRCTKAFDFLTENPGANLPAATFIID
jgi:hypothetical protein